MEPKLIYTNNEKLNSIINELKQYNPVLLKLKAEYEKLELGEFDDLIFTKIKSSGSRLIKSKFDSVINKQLRSIGVSLDVVKKTFQKEADEKFSCFENTVNEFKNFRPDYYLSSTPLSIDPKYITFLNGKFTQSENDIENILEDFCRIYIRTESELKLLDALNSFIDAYYVVEDVLKSFKYNPNPNCASITAIDGTFIANNNGKPAVNPYSLNHFLEVMQKR